MVISFDFVYSKSDFSRLLIRAIHLIDFDGSSVVARSPA